MYIYIYTVRNWLVALWWSVHPCNAWVINVCDKCVYVVECKLSLYQKIYIRMYKIVLCANVCGCVVCAPCGKNVCIVVQRISRSVLSFLFCLRFCGMHSAWSLVLICYRVWDGHILYMHVYMLFVCPPLRCRMAPKGIECTVVLY